MPITEDVYKSLGFTTPKFLENLYGIKIHIGAKGKNDWCVEIPKELARLKCPQYNFDYAYVVYLTGEEEVLRIAREFTQLAERRNKNGTNPNSLSQQLPMSPMW